MVIIIDVDVGVLLFRVQGYIQIRKDYLFLMKKICRKTDKNIQMVYIMSGTTDSSRVPLHQSRKCKISPKHRNKNMSSPLTLKETPQKI
jgi:hypothetical protein